MKTKADNPVTGSGRPIRATRRSLPISLLRAREKVMGPIREILNEAGVSEQKWRILRVLEESGGLEHTAIAEAACLLLPSLTRIIRTLENDGLILKQEDRNDRRRSIVTITDKGRNLVFDHLDASNRFFQKLEAIYGKEKLAKLLDLLDELNQTKL